MNPIPGIASDERPFIELPPGIVGAPNPAPIERGAACHAASSRAAQLLSLVLFASDSAGGISRHSERPAPPVGASEPHRSGSGVTTFVATALNRIGSHGTDLKHQVPPMRSQHGRADADGRLRLLLSLPGLQDTLAPPFGRLLCILLLRERALPACPGTRAVLLTQGHGW